MVFVGRGSLFGVGLSVRFDCIYIYIYIIIIIIIGIYIAPFPFIKCSKALHIVIV